VPPRQTREVQNVRERFAQGRLLGPATPVLPLVWPASPTFARPQLAGLGNAAELTWDFNRQRYKYVFAGRTIWQPEQNVPVPGPPSTVSQSVTAHDVHFTKVDSHIIHTEHRPQAMLPPQATRRRPNLLVP
jgi:hypothetical protein